MSSPSSWNQSDQGPRQRRPLQQADDGDGVGYVRGEVGWSLFGAGGWMGLPPSPCQCRRARTRLPPAPDTRHAFKTWAGARTSGCGAPEWQSCYDLLAGDLNAAVLPSSSAHSPHSLVRSELLAFGHSLKTLAAVHWPLRIASSAASTFEATLLSWLNFPCTSSFR